ncbi:phosphotransferase family protein [Pseudomaricurvus alcaniphilus]|uniref:phosphotransferase family protein n=1 Tax=Pseudomaricurvus alcaniphilus TaxID=1166482 RepID=UPI00140B5DCF|nr:phosphotransferase family protein [Pseudomaricurvus alcaniphilus]NHN36528.1 phosphotransferase family protein [Pseudomaricurvus alcaniphilus]
MSSIDKQFAAYLQHKMPQVSNVEVLSVGQIFGGASRETYRMKVQWQEAGETINRGLIVRREAAAGLINTESETEFRAFEAFSKTSVPVPEALYLEEDASWLDRAFIVTSEITDSAAGSPFSNEPYGENREKSGRQMFEYLGEIVRQDPEELGLVGILAPTPIDQIWSVELNRWQQVIDELPSPEPIAQAAIRWLRNNPPPVPVKTCVVHGDYRSGNFMANEAGDITAILDWEMAHIGDPLEDLCWAIDPIWGFKQPNRVGGLIQREEALRIFEQSSGIKIDQAALQWWELFSCVKGLGIWTTAAKEFKSGANPDPMLLVTGIAPYSWHERLTIEKLIKIQAGVIYAN